MNRGKDLLSSLALRSRTGWRQITAHEMGAAAAALSEFNRQAGGRFQLGPWVDRIVRRARDVPSFTAEQHVSLVQAAFKEPWWHRRGNKGRATPAVIWGNERVFAKVLEEAHSKPVVDRYAEAARRKTERRRSRRATS